MTAIPPSAASRGIRVRIKNTKDAGAGLTFLAIGIFATFYAQEYDLGTALNMGPGYFPLILGVILSILGLINCVRSVSLSKPESIGPLAWRPLILIPLGVLLFGLLIERAGLALAIVALVILSRLGSREFRWGEALITCGLLIALAGSLFVYGLQLPASALLPN